MDINSGGWGAERAVSVILSPTGMPWPATESTARDFASAVAREIRGPVGAQRLELGGEETTVSLKAQGARERALDDLRAAMVPNQGDSPIRVGDLALVSERPGLATVIREDQQYLRTVSYDFRGPQRLATRTHDAFMQSVAAPPGYVVSDYQVSWDEDESAKGLWLVFAIGVILVMLSVALIFDSVWASAMVFLSLPLALAGVGGVFWITKSAFTREAAVGVILVVGLAVNQAILLVDAALERRADGQTGRRARRSLTVEDVLHAASDRAGMIVLVTLTTMASLIPLAVGATSNSLFGSIALATAGGTVAGTIGALWIVPALLRGSRRRLVASA